MTLRVACVGDCGVDKYDGLGPSGFLARPGGCTLNFAVNLARLRRSAVEVDVVSAVGDDPAGRELRALLAREPLTPHVLTLPGQTPRQDLVVLPDGERQFTRYHAGMLWDWAMTAEQRAVVGRADWVVTVLYAQLEAFVTRLLDVPRRGALALDFMNLVDYGHTLSGRAREALELVTLAFFGLSPQHEAVIAELRERTRTTAQTFVVTLGAEGALCLEGGRLHRGAAVPVAKVVDTTGAGDSFAAAFLAARLNGADPVAALAAGARNAAGVVGQFGAFDPKLTITI